MPRCFYDVEDRGRRVTDDLGIDLDDLAAAMREATILLKLLMFEGRFVTRPGTIRVAIRDEVTGSIHEIGFDCGRG